MSRTRHYGNWQNMKRRCYDPTDKDFRNYGARGVVVCERWRESFENFWADMGPTYAPGLTLGRKDNDGPYSPENCRWEDARQQGRNRRTNTLLRTPKGEMTLQDAAVAYGLNPVTLSARLRRYGWPLEKALNTPVRSTTSSTADRATGL